MKNNEECKLQIFSDLIADEAGMTHMIGKHEKVAIL